MKYARILLASVAVPITAIVLISAIAVGYAFTLAFAIRGAPDQAQITRFAQHLGRISWTPSQAMLTIPFAMWASRTFRAGAWLCGTIVGMLVAAIEFVPAGEISAPNILDAVLIVGAGCLGGVLGARVLAGADRRRASDRQFTKSPSDPIK
ncbi:MAG TPA: hypothetical protein VG871_00895 [Vicinamibacterales bacterium]|nr:hypothetical protein [Vicinamibacterales bacterium]